MNLCLTYMLASSLAKFVMDDQFQNGTQILKSRFQEMVIIWLAKNYPLSLSLVRWVEQAGSMLRPSCHPTYKEKILILFFQITKSDFRREK